MEILFKNHLTSLYVDTIFLWKAAGFMYVSLNSLLLKIIQRVSFIGMVIVDTTMGDLLYMLHVYIIVGFICIF